MPRLFVPPPLRDLSGGQTSLEVPGQTVGEALSELEKRCPGVRDRLVEDGRLRPGLSATVDGAVAARGLLHPVAPESEVHFLPALGGG